MQIKRIANEIHKIIGFQNVFAENGTEKGAKYHTIFTGVIYIPSYEMSLINDILIKYNVKISALGVDSYGFICFDLTEIKH